ncbi:MAG TPA: hypothetical protein VJ760_05545 [Nitrospiraceae bacterium]|nr:hypothetical protein [Nitrospiraceae bacterium]
MSNVSPENSDATVYPWEKTYAHIGGGELRRLRQVEAETVRRRERAGWVHATFQGSCPRACRFAQFSRAVGYRRSRDKDQAALRLRFRDLAYARHRDGSLRIGVL